MLYTVVSEYDIFLSGSARRLYKDVPGGKIEYTGKGKGRRIVGLFSTDPKMYLRREYLPGQKL